MGWVAPSGVAAAAACRGTTTVGAAARATRGAWITTCRSAGEAWAGPGVGARAGVRVSGARVRGEGRYSSGALGLCWGAATLGVWLVARVAGVRGPIATAQAQAEVRMRLGVGLGVGFRG